ncbi:MAG: class I SAM-dependent methyltransferase [Oscillospiraceae bacterium]
MTANNNYLPQLDARLATAAAFVREGAIAADIGCDHGKLAVALSLKCKKVIAIDLRDAPLESAKKRVQIHGCTNVECRLGDGILCLAPNEADTIIIAGLSAQTICSILSQTSWIRNEAYRFIFVPATKHSLLREYLYREGFAILDEKIAYAANRLYTVMHCAYSGNGFVPRALQCEIGEVHGEYAAEYFAKDAKKLLKEAQGSKDAIALLALAKAVQTEGEKWQK